MTDPDVPRDDHARLLAIEAQIIQFSDALCDTTALVARHVQVDNEDLHALAILVAALDLRIQKLEDLSSSP